MALKAKLTKDEFEKLSDPLKEHYKASGDDYVLDAEGVEDVSGLKSALQKTKEDRDSLKKQLAAEAEKFKDIDPERAREALKTLHELDEKKLVDRGEFDRLLKKRSDEFDQREAEYQKQIKEAQQRLDTYELINPVRDAALKAGVLPKSLDLVLADMRVNSRVKLNDKRQVVVLDKDGDPTDLSLDKYFGEVYKNDYPNLYAASGAGGSGASANNGNGATGKKTMTREQLNALPLSEQRTIAIQASKGEVTLTD